MVPLLDLGFAIKAILPLQSAVQMQGAKILQLLKGILPAGKKGRESHADKNARANRQNCKTEKKLEIEVRTHMAAT